MVLGDRGLAAAALRASLGVEPAAETLGMPGVVEAMRGAGQEARFALLAVVEGGGAGEG